MKVHLQLMKNIIKKSAKSDVIPLESITVASATKAAIQR